MYFDESVEVVAKAIDAIGVAVIVGGVLLATTLVARTSDTPAERVAPGG